MAMDGGEVACNTMNKREICDSYYLLYLLSASAAMLASR